MAVVPVVSVPIRFPAINDAVTFPVIPRPLPEIVLPVPATVPPMVVLVMVSVPAAAPGVPR